MSMRIGDESAPGPRRGDRPDACSASEAVPAGGGGAVARGVAPVPPPHAGAWSALGFLVFMVLACFVGAHFAPSPTEQHLLEPPSGPSWAHWFGTDELSRDSLSRVLHGGQISLQVALGVAMLSTVHRRGDRRARRLLPRLARRPAHALHRPLDRAARAAVPRGGGVDRHGRSRPARRRSTSAARSASRCSCRACCGVRSRAWCAARRWRCASASSSTPRARSARRTRGSSCGTCSRTASGRSS